MGRGEFLEYFYKKIFGFIFLYVLIIWYIIDMLLYSVYYIL